MDKRGCLAAYIQRNFEYMRKGWKGLTGAQRVMAIRDQVLILQQGTGTKSDRRLLFDKLPKDKFPKELEKFFNNRGFKLTPQEKDNAMRIFHAVGDYLTTTLLKGSGIKDTSEVTVDDIYFNERLNYQQQTFNTDKVEEAMKLIEEKVLCVKPVRRQDGTQATDPGGWPRYTASPSWMRPIDKERGSEVFFACAAAQQDTVDFKDIVSNVREARLPKPNFLYYAIASKVEDKPEAVEAVTTPEALDTIRSVEPRAYASTVNTMIRSFTAAQGDDDGQ